VRVEVVISGVDGYGDVDLQKRLPQWIRLVDVTELHLANPLPGGIVCRDEPDIGQ
jgi:hypothetical protein